MRALVLLCVGLASAAAAQTVSWHENGFIVVLGEDEDVPFVRRFDVYHPRGVEAQRVDAAPLALSLAGPGGAVLEVTSKAETNETNWSGKTYTPTLTVTALVKLGTRSWPVTLPFTPESVRAWWSPDGRRLLLCVRESLASPEEYFVMPGPFPRVSVLHAPKVPLTRAQFLLVDGLAEKAGCVVSFAGEAKKARPASVIYVAKGFETEAKTLSESLPGGATVEPLTWETNANLVIAIGDSFKPKK